MLNKHHLEDLFAGVEDLHISKGSEIAFIKQLKKKGYFIWDQFKILLKNHLGRNKLGDLDGAHITELIMKFEQIIIPSFSKKGDRSSQTNFNLHFQSLQNNFSPSNQKGTRIQRNSASSFIGMFSSR